MSFFKKLGRSLFPVAGNTSTREGSLSRGLPPRQPTPPAPDFELAELADAEAATDEAAAADILRGLDTEEAKLFAGEWVHTPQSSNVTAFRYRRDESAIEIEFHGGSFYRVDPISDGEAVSFLHAPSFGKWYWQNVRIPGTKLGHQKNYVWLSGPSRTQRKWNASAESAAAHGRKADRQSSAFAKGGLGKKRGKRK